MKKSVLSLIATLLCSSLLLAQTGTISGKMIEAESGFEVIGGNIVIQGTGIGTSSDLDGSYSFKADAGTYTLECSYVGFDNVIIAEVVVEAGKVTTVDVSFGGGGVDLAALGVEVVARQVRNTETALLTIQKKSAVVLDGISSSQMSKSGDSDVASAVKRVTGVTVQDGKYIYVRGLGDRYSKTTLNGSNIPGLDPNKNTVQMDMFPTNLIDNILVYKTFAPNLPGDFSGGYVDIITKDFPETRLLTASASVGYNTNATFNNNFLSQQSGATDWLGMDDGTRALPGSVDGVTVPEIGSPDNPNVNADDVRTVIGMTNDFKNNFAPQTTTALPDHSFSLSAGNQKTLFGKPLGFIAALNYQKDYNYYEGGKTGIYSLSGPNETVLNKEIELTDRKGSENTLWGAMLNTSYKLSPTHKIGLTLMHNQNGESISRTLSGKKLKDDVQEIYDTYVQQYKQRALSTAQLSGKHVFTNANNLELNWSSAYALSSQDEPDFRTFTTRKIPHPVFEGEYLAYYIKQSSDRVPTRFYRDLEQSNFDNKLDLSLPFNQWNGLSSKVSVGGSYLTKDRTYTERRYSFISSDPNLKGEVNNYLDPENLLQYNGDVIANPEDGVYLREFPTLRNNYEANQQVAAAYAMVELPLTSKLRLITGARMEQTQIQFLSPDEDLQREYPEVDGNTNLINTTDVLPSVNMNYEVSEQMKIRAAYNKTLARPTFRELAPVVTFDFDGGFIEIGNPELERTLVDNVDLRWELYPSASEMISVSAFYKRFENPIERTYNPEAPNGEFTWKNVDQAQLAGAEFEARKDLGAWSAALEGFSLSANFSYIVSRSDIAAEELALIRGTDPDHKDYRAMFGQAPYVANALLSYKKNGWSANVAYNLVGERITYITIGGTPNIYEMPRHLLNANVAKELNDHFTLKLSATNILNAQFREVITYKDVEYATQSFRSGVNFSVGLSYQL
jgi:outer membrane receptor protein involved in Fe transport